MSPVRIIGVLVSIYMFLMGLDMMGSSFLVLGGKGAGRARKKRIHLGSGLHARPQPYSLNCRVARFLDSGLQGPKP